MPAFAKNPKFIIGAIVVLWLVYVIYANFEPEPIPVYLLPFGALQLSFRISAVIIGAAVFGALVTMVIQLLWRRRSSKTASPSL
jgi:hypothetical protein